MRGGICARARLTKRHGKTPSALLLHRTFVPLRCMDGNQRSNSSWGTGAGAWRLGPGTTCPLLRVRAGRILTLQGRTGHSAELSVASSHLAKYFRMSSSVQSSTALSGGSGTPGASSCKTSMRLHLLIWSAVKVMVENLWMKCEAISSSPRSNFGPGSPNDRLGIPEVPKQALARTS